MLLPIRTSIRPWRTPYANYLLIALNVAVFMMQYRFDPVTGDKVFRNWVNSMMLTPGHWRVWQLLTYAFLHDGFWHIAGNMFFLYLFGNNVNDKLGNIGYLGFYIAGAIFSGAGHLVFNAGSNIPTLGASGAISAVTGAYLVLFPQTLITILYWFIFIGTADIPALYFIAFKMILWDNIMAQTHKYIAYEAHLAGYTFGIGAVLLMLSVGLIQTSNFDMWAMLRRWNRRRHYRDVVSKGFDPFAASPKITAVKAQEVDSDPQRTEQVQQLRNSIARRLYERNLSAAAEEYEQLMKIDPEQILARQHLLDIANQLASDGKSVEAAVAYEQFLKHYSNYEYVEQVQLMLGLIYARYLDQPDRAREHLAKAAERLSDPGQLQMCRDQLQQLDHAG